MKAKKNSQKKLLATEKAAEKQTLSLVNSHSPVLTRVNINYGKHINQLGAKNCSCTAAAGGSVDIRMANGRKKISANCINAY